MNTIDFGGWRFFVEDAKAFDRNKVGKWMYFYRGEEGRAFAERMAKEAVEQGIVQEAKCSLRPEEGVSCYYLNCDDNEGHKRVINYFMANKMIPKTKPGKLYNISFKLDNQTRAGEYGDDFVAELKLADLMDLVSGEWKI